MKYEYPAIFFPDDGGIGVRFYDVDLFTCGDDMAEAVEMAEDILGGRLMRMERDGLEIPRASRLDEVILASNETARMIHADTEAYARELKAQLLRESKINSVRTAAGMTIKKIAEILGAPYATIQKWDSGKVKPSPWVERLAIQEIERYIAANQ